MRSYSNNPSEPRDAWTEFERLGILARYGSLNVPSEPHLEGVVQLAAHLCGTPFAVISLFEEKRHWMITKTGHDIPKAYLDQLHADHSIFTEGLLTVSDMTQDSRFQAMLLLEMEPGFRFYASAPIMSKEGLVLGVVCVLDHYPREFGNAQRSALKILAERIEHYIEMRVLMDTQYKIIEYLRTNDERIQTSLYSAEIGTWDWDIINDRLIGDAHYAKLLNISEEKAGSGFAASTMFENIHDDDRQRGYDYLIEFFNSGKTHYAVEYRIKYPDGSYRWICSRGRCSYTHDKKPRRLSGCSYARERHRPKDFSLFDDTDWTYKLADPDGTP